MRLIYERLVDLDDQWTNHYVYCIQLTSLLQVVNSKVSNLLFLVLFNNFLLFKEF